MMRWRLLVLDIREGARRHPSRIVLPFAGIALGMFVLAVVLGIVAGLRQQARSAIAELGVNSFAILPLAGDPSLPALPLTRRHAELLRGNLLAEAVTAYQAGESLLDGKTVRILHADEYLWRVRPWPILAGRPLDADDMRNRTAVAVISDSLSRETGWTIGQAISIGPETVRVAGIVSIESGAMESVSASPRLSPGDRVVIVPWTLPAYWAQSPVPREDSLDVIFVRSRAAESPGPVVSAARRLLGDPHYACAPLSWITPATLVAQLQKLRQRILMAGGLLAALCLLMSGITLGSLMCANVQARIPEIGLRRALGASPADIGLLFVLEAVFLTACATLLGAGTAAMLLPFTARALPVPVATGFSLLLLPMATSILLGIAFSLAPARIAARIAPAEALRNE